MGYHEGMKFTPVLGIGLVIFIALGVYFAFFGIGAPLPEQKGCTMEAKICPDGSAVGRTGPDCEFAACPTPTPTPPTGATSATLRAAIGQTVSGLDVSLTPLAVISDSRCPVDVQCIWAGTVTLKVRIQSGLGTSEMTFELGKAITTEAEEITLTEVSPAPYAGVAIPASAYRFTFEVKKR